MFEKLISWEMALRGGSVRARAGKLIRKVWPDFMLADVLLRTVGSHKQVMVNGRRMFVDMRDSAVATHLFTTGTWEPEETKLVSNLLKEGNVFVDVGANIGYFTLLASAAVGKTGKVFAFEPEPNNYSLLQKNVKVNRCGNVNCERKAVTNADQLLELHLSDFNYGDHRIYQSHDDEGYNHGHERVRTQIQGVALDNYFSPGTRIDLLKMDVQGAEYFALQGMKRLLNDNPHIILILEFWPHGLQQAGIQPTSLLQELADLGFLAHRLENETLLPWPWQDISQTPEGDAPSMILSRKKLAIARASA